MHQNKKKLCNKFGNASREDCILLIGLPDDSNKHIASSKSTFGLYKASGIFENRLFLGVKLVKEHVEIKHQKTK